jgi:hypothetical protein
MPRPRCSECGHDMLEHGTSMPYYCYHAEYGDAVDVCQCSGFKYPIIMRDAEILGGYDPT